MIEKTRRIDDTKIEVPTGYKEGMRVHGIIYVDEVLEKELESQNVHLERVIQRLSFFGPSASEIKNRLDTINNRIWNLRWHLAWKRNYPDSNDFTTAQPDPNARLLLTARVDVAEMHDNYPLLDLQTEEDVFNAQI